MPDTHQMMESLIPAYELNLLEGEDRQQIERHILQCDECFDTLYHFAPVSSSLLRIQKAETVKPPEIIHRFRWQWLMIAIMALLLVMAFWIFRQSSNLQKEIMSGGAQIQLLIPKNDSEIYPPVLFRWEEQPEAEFYKIYVYQNEIMLVAGERVNLPQFEWRPSASVKPGKYQWKVESYFSDGSRIRDSVTFVIKLRH